MKNSVKAIQIVVVKKRIQLWNWHVSYKNTCKKVNNCASGEKNEITNEIRQFPEMDTARKMKESKN